MNQEPKFLPLQTKPMKDFFRNINQKLLQQKKLATATTTKTADPNAEENHTVSPTNTDEKCIELIYTLKRKREDGSSGRDSKNSRAAMSDDGMIDMGL